MSYIKATLFSTLSVFLVALFINLLLFAELGFFVIVWALIVAVIGSFICILGCLLIAIPTHVLFKSRNINSPKMFSIVGFMATVIITVVLLLILDNELQKGTIIFSMIMGLFGLLAMSVFGYCMNQGKDSKSLK